MAKKRSNKQSAAAPADARSEDEALAFRAAVRDVTPLVHEPRAHPPPRTTPRARPRKPAAPVEDLDASMPLIATEVAGAPDAAAPGAELKFQRAGVRPQLVRRLRRGLVPIDAELDLHGLTQTAARDLLADFLRYNRGTGRRCVRIIHGKGYRSGARGPVLKLAVDSWLRRHLDVLAFTSARPIDGGTGAVYVLLRA